MIRSIIFHLLYWKNKFFMRNVKNEGILCNMVIPRKLC